MGNAKHALAYVRSGEGLRLSDRFRQELRTIEDRLEHQRESFNEQGIALSKLTFIGLWIALAGVVVLGWTSSRMLARSLTGPITRLHSATAKIEAEADVADISEFLSAGGLSHDELGQLEQAYLHMAHQIGEHVHELEVLNTIGHEINTIGPDGLDGVLRRITDRAVELVEADACIVFLRDERMGCWVVEAASGEWNERLKKSVMLWEELPVCVEAFETRTAATGDNFHSDARPQVLRRNLLGESMLLFPCCPRELHSACCRCRPGRRGPRMNGINGWPRDSRRKRRWRSQMPDSTKPCSKSNDDCSLDCGSSSIWQKPWRTISKGQAPAWRSWRSYWPRGFLGSSTSEPPNGSGCSRRTARTSSNE